MELYVGISHFTFSQKQQLTNQQSINDEERNIKWSVTLNTSTINICYKTDSGAQINEIPENQIKTLQTKPRITTSTTTLRTYNGSNISEKGQCTLNIQRQGKNMSLLFIVVDTNFLRIKGRNSSRQLNLLERKPSISNSEKRNFWSVIPWRHTSYFGEIRTLCKVHLIAIDQNITAVVTPARKTLRAMLDQLKIELETLFLNSMTCKWTNQGGKSFGNG